MPRTSPSSPILSISPLVWTMEGLTHLAGQPFALYPYQMALLGDRSPRVLVLKSRQVGISTVGAILAAHELLFSERAMVLVVSRDEQAAGRFLAMVLDVLDALDNPPDFQRRGVFEAQLSNGSRILSQAATGKAGRGVRASLVILDEAAFMDDANGIFRAVSPTLSRGGPLLVISTPNGTNNLFYRLWHGEERGQWSRHRVHWQACPAFDEAWYEREHPNYTARDWAQEFDLDFVASGGAAFNPEDIEAMADGWGGLQLPREGAEYVSGVDVGRRHDATVIVTLRTDQRPYQVVAFQRLERAPYAQQQALIESRAEEYRGVLVVESNGLGDPLVEALTVPVRPFVTTAVSKAHGLTLLVKLIEQHLIKADIPELLSELRQYEWEDARLRTDCVMALMMAVTAIREGPYVSFQELQELMEVPTRLSVLEQDALDDEVGANSPLGAAGRYDSGGLPREF